MFSNGNLFVCLFIVSIQLQHHTTLLLLSAAETDTIRNGSGSHNATPAATLTSDDHARLSRREKSLPDASPPPVDDAGFRIEFERLPEPMALFGGGAGKSAAAASDADALGPLPVFPERSDAVYFVVAVIGGAKVWSRTLARSLMELGPPFGSPLGPPLRPLYVDLPANGKFSVKVLTSLCQQTDGVPLAGMVVIGDGQSARAVALSGHSMGIPVLWARGGTANIHSTQSEYHATLQSMLQPSAREILEAIRALFLQTHWHSFFVLSDVEATMVLAGIEGLPLKQPPLKPTILPLPPSDGNVFRQLAEISRSTRGIVLLLCNLVSARNVMSEAKRLNMAGGHFIWLWADTSSTAEFFDVNKTPSPVVDEGDGENDDAAKLMNFPEAVKQFTGNDNDNVKPSPPHGGSVLPAPSRGGGFEANWNPFRGEKEDERFVIGLNDNSYESSELGDDSSTKSSRPESVAFSDEDEYSDEEEEDDGDAHEKPGFRRFFDATKFDNKNLDSYYNLLSGGIAANETVGNRSPKPKRTSSLHYGINASSASSHVLFHHFKDFPVGLLALRPVKMTVDQNFIRSTIRLFASTWAQVQINAARELEKNRQRVSINPYGDNLNWLPPARGRQRRRRGRRRRKRHVATDGDDDVEDVDKQRDIVNSNQPKQTSVHRIKNLSSNSTSIKTFRSEKVADSSSSTNNNLNINRSGDSNKLNSSFYIHNTPRSGNKNGDEGANSDGGSRNSTNGSYNQNLSGLTNQNPSEPAEEDTKSNTETVDAQGTAGKVKRASFPWSARRQMAADDVGPKAAAEVDAAEERYRRLGTPYFTGGCFGSASRSDAQRAEMFARALKTSTAQSMSGDLTLDNGGREHPLITKFEILNLVPDGNGRQLQLFEDEMTLVRHRGQQRRQRYPSTKWRRVGLISGRNVHLDTIVWPGGDIVVSGLSAKSRTIFRVVTALAPPFVMASELDEDGLCLRGLPCHRLLPNRKHNLTIMFNNIETQHRFTEDILEHGGKVPSDETGTFPNPMYETKCCYGLSMDLLDNIATELEFEFHLYIVHDELFGAKFSTLSDFMPGRGAKHHHHHQTTSTAGEGGGKQKQNYKTKDASSGDVNDPYPANSAGNQQQQQRRYHSPEGRTRTRRRNSASFERENSEVDATAATGRPHRRRRRRVDAAAKDDDGTPESDDAAVEDVSLNDWPPSGDDDGDDYLDDQTVAEAIRDDKAKPTGRSVQWNGIIGDLISGSADMSFAPLTVSRARAEVIDFSAPYFHGGVSLLAAPQGKSEIPLLAFLLPFSPELWIAIFTSLNVTAIAVAIYEWLSPFGLNPWGRQRSKNFSMSSALWVMWGLLCGHLVAFKAPKSWPNKFLINVWGGFSVIFIASYTANIAALIAGLFFHNAGNTPEVSLFTQRVGAPVSSSTESFMKQHRPHEWEHIKKYTLRNIEDGIRGLKNGTLDLLIGDTPILDYYRAIDHGCNLLRVGETYVEDTYAIGMKKGFPLKDSISALIAKYSSNGYLDILAEKWYGGLPCFKLDSDIIMPRPLGVAAVAGVFLLLGLGITIGVVILVFEHWFYKFMLPKLRHKPKGTVWRSRNIMFFSQKLYRFINCVELVSPHHAARELVHTLRQGQIASLFQKSIKRKEDEQRRRRKSKAQFFEMIQEIRRVQQAEKLKTKLEVLNEHGEGEGHPTIQIPEIITPHSKSPKPRSSPRSKLFSSRHKRSRSNSSTLSVRRFSNDSILSDRLDTIGRRLSRDLTNSPPDFGRRFDTLSATNTGSGSTVRFDTYSAKDLSTEKIEETKFDTYSGKELTVPTKKHQNRRTPINSDTFKPTTGRENSAESSSNSTDSPTVQLLPVLREGLVAPVCQKDRTQALLRERLHEELITKYGECEYEVIIPMADSSPPQTASQRTSFRSTNRSPPALMRHRQRSLDGLEQRPKMPSPPRSSVDTDSRHQVSSSRSNLREISLERLSREDLLRLSESTESEIHDYLSKPAIERPSLEPP